MLLMKRVVFLFSLFLSVSELSLNASTLHRPPEAIQNMFDTQACIEGFSTLVAAGIGVTTLAVVGIRAIDYCVAKYSGRPTNITCSTIAKEAASAGLAVVFVGFLAVQHFCTIS